ncbi:MAG: HDOD domain-containing protein [Gammaproteobacteria bacterium]|nr:HDOD domain-containing protein [Gammaproteobacteria bacterium]MDE2261660.1 HDOD domain-containing protein [Gammaproteobacteria bacterium]
MHAQSSPASPGTHSAKDGAEQDVAFTFVQALAAELSGGKVELPGFPHVVMRVQRVLSDDTADASKIVRVIGSEPVLATQLVRMANSAALNPGGTQVTDLRAAVTRVGVDSVRTATIAFAMRQLREAPTLRGLEMQLGVLWRRSVQVASLCFVVARRLTSVSADTALLAGLLQGIGRLYILTRASRHRSLFCDAAAYQAIEHDWHLSIAAALLENWGIADEIVQAVHESENLERESRGAPCLTDVLVVGTLLADVNGDSSALAAQVQCAKPLQRLRLDLQACERFLAESAQEVTALRDALG